MTDIFNEVFGGTDTSKLTPIEIALGIDSEGRTTAKKLYESLELDMSNYAKWFRKNILENDFAEENTDYWVFVPKDENPLGGRPTQDAKLTASFAKKLSMMQKNQKGEAARNYFVGVENGAKKLIEKLPCPLNPQIASSVAELGRVTERIMHKQGSPAYKIAEAFKMECEQFGIQLPADFVKVPEYIQLRLSDFAN